MLQVNVASVKCGNVIMIKTVEMARTRRTVVITRNVMLPHSSSARVRTTASRRNGGVMGMLTVLTDLMNKVIRWVFLFNKARVPKDAEISYC